MIGTTFPGVIWVSDRPPARVTSIDELHGNPQRPIVFASVVDTDHVRVPQASGQSGIARKLVFGEGSKDGSGADDDYLSETGDLAGCTDACSS